MQSQGLVTLLSSAEHDSGAQRKRHVVVFSADGEIEIPIYKFADGRFCPYDPSTGARRPKKQLTDAISIAREMCCALWEAKGFGSKDECRVLIQQPRENYQRKSNLFPAVIAGEEVSGVRFKPCEHGWRPVLLLLGADLTPAQKIVLFYAWDRGRTSGLFFASKKTTAKETRISLPHVKKILRRLTPAGWLIPQQAKDSEIVMTYGLSLPAVIHAKLLRDEEEERQKKSGLRGETKLPPPGTTKLFPRGETTFHSGGNSVSPEPSNELTSIRTSTRGLSRQREEELLGELRLILPKEEMQQNGGAWRTRIRGQFENRRAVEYAIEDWKVRTPDQRREIRNLSAWFNRRYMQHLVR